ncbi:SAM-dependent methyltransferase [Azospirillum lipoferum]|uniref:Methyltransferase domain-containing protein n=1 Tax=Azospirillum lipoferum TaxID=193 RepID=A0A5A9GV86_AZOLI|nr:MULTISPECIES: class I SAM-dependent methyltransferase [Azospirillum]KAA0598280.1 methyltransferase domain-containing protein [Azospirillum lipoferum]MCP1609737.1 SAM-dependent methyltransferase [Azospirillum lipoferum]MDW5534958.1 class I SAM-dependent methyltransferase [Azospirillum sp. NL1]
MGGWTEGYVGGIDYIRAVYRDWSPALLCFALTLRGWRPPEALRRGGFTMAEPGCGHGLTSALLAGAHPAARFEAMDFNPSHIAGARRLAADAGLTNAEFLEESFADYARRDGPMLDAVALHGVWSWVSAENRAILLEVLRRRLTPGGVVFVSYNALPGTLVHMPLRRLLVERCAEGDGSLPDRIARAVEFAARLAAQGGGWFANTDGVVERIEQLRHKSPNYIAHEYLNGDWTAFYHADVARELATAKLEFAGAAVPMEQLDDLTLSPTQQALATEARDPAQAETLRDMMTNRSFRRDLFVKGGERLGPAERRLLLGETRFALLVAADDLPDVASTPVGRLPFPRALYHPLGEALAEGPQSLDALLARPALAAQGEDAVLRALVLLTSLSLASPVMPEDGLADRKASCDRFNAAVLDRHRFGDTPGQLASPLLGAGVPVSRIEALFLLAASLHEEPAAFAWRHLSADGIVLGRDGERCEGNDANRAELTRRHASFTQRRLSLLNGLGVA